MSLFTVNIHCKAVIWLLNGLHCIISFAIESIASLRWGEMRSPIWWEKAHSNFGRTCLQRDVITECCQRRGIPRICMLSCTICPIKFYLCHLALILWIWAQVGLKQSTSKQRPLPSNHIFIDIFWFNLNNWTEKRIETSQNRGAMTTKVKSSLKSSPKSTWWTTAG